MSSPEAPPPPVVTIAALYGAAGTVIAPRVAERLGVRLVDREIPEEVAKRTGVSQEAVADVDQEPRSRLQRVMSSLARVPTMGGGSAGAPERLEVQERDLRSYIEEALATAAKAGGVVVGRGGMVVLRLVPWALHVHLGGPAEARVAQRMRLEGIDRETAERRREAEDRTRIDYVLRAYGVNGEHPGLYHLMLDSTALPIDTCVDVIVAASRARTENPKSGPLT